MGFEPTIPLPVCQFSRLERSTTPPPAQEVHCSEQRAVHLLRIAPDSWIFQPQLLPDPLGAREEPHGGGRCAGVDTAVRYRYRRGLGLHPEESRPRATGSHGTTMVVNGVERSSQHQCACRNHIASRSSSALPAENHYVVVQETCGVRSGLTRRFIVHRL